MIKKLFTLKNISFSCLAIMLAYALCYVLNNITYYQKVFDIILDAMLALMIIWFLASFIYFFSLVNKQKQQTEANQPQLPAKPQKEYLNVWKSLFYIQENK